MSAHLDPRAAISKAILEQAHLGPYMARLAFEEKRPIPASAEEVITLDDHALYYVPARRAAAFSFLADSPAMFAADLPAPRATSLDALVERLRAARLRIAIVDVTSADLAETPFRVARALGPGFQQIHFGHRHARLANPRLLSFCPLGPNPDPHPLA
jgi:ribosomal protein S12 methylthiotransferase accessory factor